MAIQGHTDNTGETLFLIPEDLLINIEERYNLEIRTF
jgi:hypothetical protein